MNPVIIHRFNQPYGWPTDPSATLDQLMAINVATGTIRGVSKIISMGLQLGIVGYEGDEIHIYYYDSAEQKECVKAPFAQVT